MRDNGFQLCKYIKVARPAVNRRYRHRALQVGFNTSKSCETCISQWFIIATCSSGPFDASQIELYESTSFSSRNYSNQA